MLNKSNLHHAYICEGDKDSVFSDLCKFCEEELEFTTKANPDFVYEDYDKFLISHARKLQEMQMNKSVGKKIFIVSFNFITREAQNALLKVLEEPTSGTHFFFITPSSHIFLDTVLSRVQIISRVTVLDKDSAGSKFLKAKLSERMKIVTKLVQDIKDEKATKGDALNLVRNVIRVKHKDLSEKKDSKILLSLKEAEKVADYLYDNSASVKSLMEYFAIII